MTRDLRRQRQRDTIVAAAAAGDLDRATALLAEHVVEFPDDEDLRDSWQRTAARPREEA